MRMIESHPSFSRASNGYRTAAKGLELLWMEKETSSLLRTGGMVLSPTNHGAEFHRITGTE